MQIFYIFLLILVYIKLNLCLIDKTFNEFKKSNYSLNTDIYKRTRRIIGGEQVNNSQIWPWMVSLRKYGHHICGGVIISSSFILTAAHCIPSNGLSIVIEIIQQSNLTYQDNRVRAITKVYIHSQWNAENMSNDLAILHLENRLNLTKIYLPTKFDQLEINTTVIAIGFGKEKESSTRSSDYLRQTELRILSPTSYTCKDELIDPLIQICAGLETSNKG